MFQTSDLKTAIATAATAYSTKALLSPRPTTFIINSDRIESKQSGVEHLRSQNRSERVQICPEQPSKSLKSTGTGSVEAQARIWISKQQS